MKAFKLLSIFALYFLVSGCTYHGEFIIFNSTNQHAQVTFSIPEWYSCEDNLRAKIKEGKDIYSFETEWKETDDLDYLCDGDSSLVKFTLPPRKAFLVGRTHNYFSHKEEDRDRYRAYEVQISGANGFMKIKGFKAIQAFARGQDQKFVLDY
jgi:hypothetical protein